MLVSVSQQVRPRTTLLTSSSKVLEDTKTVYEAWQIISIEDSQQWDTWKKFCGIRFGITYESMRDGFLDLMPMPEFSQEELAEKLANASQAYGAKHGKAGAKSYEQDLANRAFGLGADVYNSLQRLINAKMQETNRNPHRVRKWDLVLLREEELAITALNPQRKRKGLKSLLWWKRDLPAMDRWFVIIRGEETKYLKEGWKAYSRHSNPWSKVDILDNLNDQDFQGRAERKRKHLVPRRFARRPAQYSR